jgi:hypothetical protein
LEHPVPKHIRSSDVVLVLVLTTLAYVLVVRQKREVRLQAALAEYQSQAHIKIIEWLQRPNRVNWPDGTTLAEAIEGIRHSATPLPKGVPVLVDPIGLRKAGKSLNSQVKAIPPTSGPLLQDKLRLVLEPLGLTFKVKNASIVITARESLEKTAEGDEPPRDSQP